MVPPKHPKMIILVGKSMVVGYHHFRNPHLGKLTYPNFAKRERPIDSPNGNGIPLTLWGGDPLRLSELVEGSAIATLKQSGTPIFLKSTGVGGRKVQSDARNLGVCLLWNGYEYHIRNLSNRLLLLVRSMESSDASERGKWKYTFDISVFCI